ncbi:MAG: enoyl-CoA hydratase [Pseudomonadota bacterium]
MLGNDTGIRLFSAAFSLVVSASFMAYAIIPASPGLIA